MEIKKELDGNNEELEMTFDINVLEHLGLKMYNSLPAVVSEYVANSWDAGALSVDITTENTGDDQPLLVRIIDNGAGMSFDEVNKKFLKIGRVKRDADQDGDSVTVNGAIRKYMGRKGIGKLAGFGIAGKVVVDTTKDGERLKFEMDYDKMKEEAKKAEDKQDKTLYHPRVLLHERTDGSTHGTTVELAELKRKKKLESEPLRKNIALRFSFKSDSNFVVRVNGQAISVEDMRMREKCEYVWDIDESINNTEEWQVRGWIGTTASPVADASQMGVAIFARGKVCVLPTLFDLGSKGFKGQFATAYLMGEIQADFLDEDTDEIKTDRTGISLEGEKGRTLWDWGKKKIIHIASEWVEKRGEQKLKEFKTKKPNYAERVDSLPGHEKKIVNDFIKKLVAREDITPEAVADVAEFVIEGAEYKGFIDMLNEIEKMDIADPQKIIGFLKEWEIFDAIEMTRVIEGRLNAIFQFKELIDNNAREVPDIHNFLVDNPWLFDARWSYVDDEVRFSDLLKSQFKESADTLEEDRRLDFLCLGYGNTLYVIEIKRPSVIVGDKELNQLREYVTFIDTHKGSSTRSVGSVIGYLIAGPLKDDATVLKTKRDWEKLNLYVYTYDELLESISKEHKRFIEVLQRKGERVKDLRLHDSIERLKEQFDKT